MLGTGPAGGQEPASAELFLDAYSDTFQEKFFEALKEKGIENYDRAAALLQECKQMQPDNPVLDHELAKTLAASGDYPAAESYALKAVQAEPTEYWYLNTLMNILKAGFRSLDNVATGLPVTMPAFRTNLAKWHLEQAEFERALGQIEGLPETPEVAQLRSRAEHLADSTRHSARAAQNVQQPAGPEEGSTAYYMQLLEGHLSAGRWEEANTTGSEAIEMYPVQPFFYFARGQALLALGKAAEALGVLEMGEELLLEEGPLAQRLYKALEETHTALGNEEKARTYKNRLKTGL